MRFSWMMGVVIASLAAGAFSQDCDSIRKEGSKYYCGEVRLKTKADFQSVLASNPEALSTYNGALGLAMAGNIFGQIGGALLGYGLGSMLFKDDPIYPTLMAVGGGIAVIGIGMSVGAGSKVKNAILIYNGGKNQSPTSDLFLDVYPNGAMVTYLFGH
jgi:hypothetical protein